MAPTTGRALGGVQRCQFPPGGVRTWQPTETNRQASTCRPHCWAPGPLPTARGASSAWLARLRCAAQSGALVEPAPLAAGAAAAEPAGGVQPGGGGATYLQRLHIRDFALVAEQSVSLHPGLNVVTGESGSGKSVLVEALAQLLGAAAYEEVVRPPAEVAVVEGTLAVGPAELLPLRALLRGLGLPDKALHGEVLTIRREIARGPGGARSRCWLNGVPTSVRVLREVGRLLVDVNGQHAALALRDPATQLALLDRLAGTLQAAAQLGASLSELQRQQAQLGALHELSDEQQREAMQALVDEVYGAGVEAGEDRRLRQQLRQLDARRAAAERCSLVSVGLGGDSSGGGIAEALGDVERHMLQLLKDEERLAAEADGGGELTEQTEESFSGAEEGEAAAAQLLQAAVEAVGAAQEALEQAGAQVARYGRRYRFSQPEYDGLAERLQQLGRLLRQHGVATADELLQLAEEQAAALDAYYQMEGRRGELESAAQLLLGEVQAQALALSRQRREAAHRLRAAVGQVLQDLAMAGSSFEARLSWTPAAAASSRSSSTGRGGGSSGGSGSSSSSSGSTIAIGEEEAAACGEASGGGRYCLRPTGLDAAEFLFASGPAEPLRPLAVVASGGESARIMLALKAAPALVAAAAAAAAAAATEAEGAGGSSHQPSSSGGQGEGQQWEQEEEQWAVGGGGAAAALAAGAPIVVLDEIDSGVGSRLGQSVGAILRQMVASAPAAPSGSAAAMQILCVSHLPQVAAHAQHHLCVRKAPEAGPGSRVVTQFQSLGSYAERRAEVAAMLGLPPAAAEEVLAAAGHRRPD